MSCRAWITTWKAFRERFRCPSKFLPTEWLSGAGNTICASQLQFTTDRQIHGMETTAQDTRQWIGRSETASDIVTATPYAALSATLDWPPERPPTGTPLPP